MPRAPFAPSRPLETRSTTPCTLKQLPCVAIGPEPRRLHHPRSPRARGEHQTRSARSTAARSGWNQQPPRPSRLRRACARPRLTPSCSHCSPLPMQPCRADAVVQAPLAPDQRHSAPDAAQSPCHSTQPPVEPHHSHPPSPLPRCAAPDAKAPSSFEAAGLRRGTPDGRRREPRRC